MAKDWVNQKYAQKSALERQQLLEEKLRDRIIQGVTQDVDYIVKTVAPGGRPPFMKKLNANELQMRLNDATPDDWEKWRQEIAALPPGDERSKKLGEYFMKWASSPMVTGGADDGSGEVAVNPSELPGV